MRRFALKQILILATLALACVFAQPAFAMNVSVSIPEKYTTVQPGERLYFELAIKYPENKTRKDLRLHYQIVQNGNVLTQTKVLRAIETQASFMDFITVPMQIKAGSYVLNIVIEDYEHLHKEVSVSFAITPKRNPTLILAGGAVLGILFLIVLLLIVQIAYTRTQWKKALKAQHDYTNIPLGRRIYYEMISDAIGQMRMRVGRQAIMIASNIDGLTISKDGRVDNISKDPSEVIAELVRVYKNEFGKDVSFALK